MQVQRERMGGYNVTTLDPSQITYLDGRRPPVNAEIRFFASDPKTLVTLTPRNPIVQSYVDIW
jgi:hypothetical protein